MRRGGAAGGRQVTTGGLPKRGGATSIDPAIGGATAASGAVPAIWRSAAQCATHKALTESVPELAQSPQVSPAGIAMACAIAPRSIPHAASATPACPNA